MTFTQILFIALSLSFLGSITYLVLIYFKKEMLESDININKFQKFILLYVLPTISFFLIIAVIVFFGFIDLEISHITILGGVLYAFGIICIFIFSPYLGIFLVSLSIFGMLFAASINFIEKNINEEILILPISNHVDDNSNKEDLLIMFDTQEENITFYAFMQYDENIIKENNNFKEFDINFLLETDNYEIIDDKNERIEIIKENIESHSIYSYFKFCEPDTSYKYGYKIYINENSIKLD